MIDYLQELNKKKVLVTGGLGFIGLNLVEELTSKYECEVTIVDDESNASRKILNTLSRPNLINYQNISVLNNERLFPLLSNVHYIFHLACVQIAASSKDPIHDLRVNAESTLALLNYIRGAELPFLKRFVYTSSCSVYGNSANNLPAREDGAVAPLSHYAASKLLGEQYTIIYNSQYGVPTSVVRYSNVYGFGQSPQNPYCGVLGKFVHNVLTDQPCLVIGDGEQTRDYTFILDAIKATLTASTHPRAIGEIFNIGTGKETSVNQLVGLLKSLKGDISINYVPERDIDNIRRRVIDAEMIHTKLGWAPEFDIKRGIDETYKWYQRNLMAGEKKKCVCFADRSIVNVQIEYVRP